MQIAPGIAMLEIPAVLSNGPGVVNPALLWDEENAMLVDTAFPGQLPQLRAAIEGEGVPFARLDMVVLTHGDMDHLGGLTGLLEEAPRIEVIAGAGEKPYIQGEQPPIRLAQMESRLDSLQGEQQQQMQALCYNLRANYKKLCVPVDRTPADGEVLPVCGGVTVIHTPGHTPGHLCLYHAHSRTLISGDALNVSGDGRLLPSPESLIVDKDAARRSLQKLAGFDIETVICYHGGLYRGDANQRIRKLAGSAVS